MKGYKIIGWISRGMDDYKGGKWSTSNDVRVPPKIYRTEAVANRYGIARPVFIEVEDSDRND